jgi:inner membrane protein
MATFLAHAAVPLITGRVVPTPEGLDRRRLAWTAVAVACVQDLDYAGIAFDIRIDDALGHRGASHSLVFSAVLGLVAALLAFRGKHLRATWPWLSLAAASHGLVDMFSRGELGVALFWPFSSARLFFPVHLLPSAPLGVDEVLSRFGFIALFNEVVLLLLPLWLATELSRRLNRKLPFAPLARAAVAWAALALGVWALMPSLYAPTLPRVIKGYGAIESDEDLEWILRDPLPDGRLVTNFGELSQRGLFGKALTPERAPWSSSFFPAWYGGEAGRWKDSRVTLVERTLFGFTPLTAPVAKSWLEKNSGEGLAPSEKYDLAHADYDFKATRHSLTLTHNMRPYPRFWFGLCNGVAQAAIDEPEPFRTVEVQSPDGHTVRFHPVDVKALLAESYYWTAKSGVVGGVCLRVGFDPGRECSMNPGGLAIGTLNYVGLARRSFLIDVHPTYQSQNYAVAEARVDVMRAPYAPTDEPFEPGMKERVAQLVDVDFHYQLSSTVLPLGVGNEPDGADGTRFKKVGPQLVSFQWQATLALDAKQEVIGGRWRGDPANGPDSAAFLGGGPRLDGGTGTTLEVHPGMEWPFIRELARASVDEGAGVPRLSLDGGTWVRAQ